MKRATILALALLSAPAFAQDEEAATNSNVAYQEVTNIDFEALSVEGQLIGPDGEVVFEPKRAKSFNFIQLRTDFNSEMTHSVTEVR